MENTLINVNIVDEDEKYPVIARLIEIGRQKSYVTIDDILQFFPEAEQDVSQLEDTFAALMSAGIPYLEDVPTDEPTDEELDKAEEEESEVEEPTLDWIIFEGSKPRTFADCRRGSKSGSKD